ncbi:probable inactive leucine-rich repeat receptor-like protein kinase At3g03770 isoform X2 [Neltuma alba]|uniref:probable inactive leucine-rich repeat receptor-like protein kinase At3g03770 isoform X2 n=1 Tax=Neltuma alba TaxID=207710 RepID=UPI0010A31E3A|nr:probable inactive leucine-rich repeat receptor-like protein kinase At3g03770 isoform X2 [Prosopis alba]
MPQADPMRRLHICFLVLLWILSIPSTHELQVAQTQVLLQMRMYLEYPASLQSWGSYNGDLCNLSSSAHVSIKCQDNSVSELKIRGDKTAKSDEFKGFAIPNQTLSTNFSIDSFITALTRLTSLRVLSLVSLGIWGHLPDKIHRLSLLEVLDLSSNFLFGSIPPKISTMVQLNTLKIDDNYFNDSMPDWFDSLSNLNVLSLKTNTLRGSFPSSLCKIKNLTDISLSRNELSGKLPDLSALTGLRVLNLRENRLGSKLPLMPAGVVTVLLSNNSFSGEIPKQFSELGRLQHLDLSANHLSGIPPSFLFSLPSISYLNLGSNVLSGSLPDKLSCSSKLGFVDISSNKLIGELPSCLANTSNRRVVKYDGNCLTLDSQDQQPGSYCEESNTERKKSMARKITLAGAILIGLVLVLGISVLGVFFCRKCLRRRAAKHHLLPKNAQDNSTTGFSSQFLANARFISQAVKLGAQATSICRPISVEELREATRDFDLSAFISEGSLGKLYKGKLENGSYVAIRSLVLSEKCSIQNLKARLDLFSKLQHPNLVSLLGYCIDNSEQDDSTTYKLHLVYEYVLNGSYRAYLSEFSLEKPLKWSDRLAILIGVAKAVHFLHTGVIPGCFNNRLKTDNILLDEHRFPKLSDYGMSILGEEIERFEAKRQDSKSCQRAAFEDDVYNFGFILLESLVGPIASGQGEAFFLNEKASFGSQDGRRKIVDPIVLTSSSQESLSIAIAITTKCISPELSSRPSFEDVLWNLQYAAQVQATADADQNSESTSESQDYRRDKSWDSIGSHPSPTKQIIKPQNHRRIHK